MSFCGPNSERILILAPHGRDAEVASSLLQGAGWPTLVCSDVVQLSKGVTKGAGCAVVVEDVIASDGISILAATISRQPPWSDFPIVVLTSRADDAPERNLLAIRLQDTLGNVTFLERPFHPTTLVNVVRAALRSRVRQYGSREVLERRDLLARELQHRTKNLLSVIQAIASASLKKSDGTVSYFNRLHALAKAQDLIIEGAGRGALMRQVVEHILESFATRFSVDGPDVFLNPEAAQSFALALHELATNAVKHGSLSNDDGNVSVHWDVDATTTEPTIHFQWRERGGPVVRPPQRKGFGTILLERIVPTSNAAPPRLDYSPDGFSYEVHTILAARANSRLKPAIGQPARSVRNVLQSGHARPIHGERARNLHDSPSCFRRRATDDESVSACSAISLAFTDVAL